jgi:hypothetical protein
MNLKHILLLALCVLLPLAGSVRAQGDGSLTPIEFGETATGTITTPGEELTFLFEANSGDQITATVTAVDGSVAPILELTTFTRTLLSSDTDDEGEGRAQLTYVIPANGAYLLNVRGASATTGPIEITLQAGIIQPTPEPTAETVFTAPTSVPGTDNIGTDDPATATDSATTAPTVPTNARLQRIEIGSTVSASLQDDSNFKLYAFIGQPEQQLTITPDPRTSFQPLLVFYDSGFNEITRAQPGEPMQVTLETADLYFIAAATLQPGLGGPFGFSLLEETPEDPTPATAPGDALVYGDTVQGLISNSVPSQRYRFRGGTGDTVTFSMATTSGDLDAYMLLVDASGNLIAEDNDSGQDTNAQMSVELPADGDYFIIATRRGQEQGLTAGEFVLAITSNAEPLPVNDAATLPDDFVGLPTLDYGTSADGRITDVVFQETYVFFGQAGDAIEIAMEGINGSGLDPLLILLDNQRIPIAENDDADGQNAQITVTLPQAGYYAIVATRFELDAGTSSGEYTLTLETQADGGTIPSTIDIFTQLDPVRVTLDAAPTGRFAPLEFADVYTFSVAQGALIDMAITTADNSLATIILTDSDLNFIAATNNGIILAQTAPSSDDYLAFVAPQAGPAANVSGQFTVTLNADAVRAAANRDETEAAPITYGSTVRGTITDEQPQVRYVFQARAGDVAEIAMTATGAQSLDTLVQLRDAEGDLVEENDDIDPGIVRNSFLSVEIPADGEYIIVATRYSGTTGPITTGDFSLSLDYQDPVFAAVDRQANEIGYNETINGTISDEVRLRFFYFEGNQGDNIVVEVDATEGNLDGVLYLYGVTTTGDYVLLSVNDDSELGNTLDPRIEYTLPRTGGYLLAVTRFEDGEREPSAGEFTLRITEQE